MAENAAALIGSGLHKRFLVKETGQTIGAVTDVSLEIPVGTLTALVGPDGAGKTTLLRMMAGLMVPDEGRLEVLGIDVQPIRKRFRTASAICRSASGFTKT